MPIHHRRFAFALAGLIGLIGAAHAQPPWEQQRNEEMREREDRIRHEMREREEHRDDRIRHEEREAEFNREREWRHRHEEERRAEEKEQFRHDDRRFDQREFNR